MAEEKEAVKINIIAEIKKIMDNVRACHPGMVLRLPKDQKLKGAGEGKLDDGAISAYNCMAGSEFLKLEKLWGTLQQEHDELVKKIAAGEAELKVHQDVKAEMLKHIDQLERDLATAVREVEIILNEWPIIHW